MSRKSQRAKLHLNASELHELKEMYNSRVLEKRLVDRAKVLLHYYEGMEITSIALKVGLSRPAVYSCIDKALALGVNGGLHDLPHRPKEPDITAEAKAWVTHLACIKPKDLGFAAEVWSMASLARYVREIAEENGYACLNRAAKATIHRILKANKLHPHKIKYYLEKRDPEFEKKMKEVLIVYKEVELQKRSSDKDESDIITVCIDEKPGIQAIGNTAPDLMPVAGKYSSINRDHEYVRHGTASALAGIDLHDGYVFAQVHHRHRSIEFIGLLKEIDAYYPKGKRIRVILDNHSSHTSKETRAFLATLPNRFIYVHTPKHGSWLNLAETLFGKMARTFLRHIRVKSWEELKERILKGIAEINQSPVTHTWRSFDKLPSQ